MRLSQRILTALAVLGVVFAMGGVAQAHPARSLTAARADVPGVSVALYTLCQYGGVEVSNTSGAPVKVRVYLNGQPFFASNDWYDVPNGATGNSAVRLSGDAPANGAVFTVYVQDGANEVLAGQVTYNQPDYCDDYDISYLDLCTSVQVTITNHHGSAVDVNILKLSGSTFTILPANVALADGETKTFDITITNQPDKWVTIAPIVIPPNDRLDIYTLKGAEPGCVPDPIPTPTPSPSSSGSTSQADQLPTTGSGAPWRLFALGAGLVLLGVLAIAGARRLRSRA